MLEAEVAFAGNGSTRLALSPRTRWPRQGQAQRSAVMPWNCSGAFGARTTWMPPGRRSSKPWPSLTRPGWPYGGYGPCTSSARSTCSTTPAPAASPRPVASPTSWARPAPARSSTCSSRRRAMFRFELDEAERHAQSALAISTRLGLSQLRAVVLVFLAEVHAMRRDRARMERYIALASAAAPGDPEIEGSALAGARGMLALLDDDTGRRPRRPRPGNRRARYASAARPGALPRPVAAAARRAGRRQRRRRPSATPGTSA